MNANPLVWGHRRLPQLANLICDDDDEEMTNNVDDEALSSIFNKMKELSLQGLDRLANSVQPEIEKCVRLATEAEKEKDQRERLAAEEEEKERERLAAEAKKVEEEARIALAAVEAKAKEERLAVEAKEKKEKEERERLAADAKAKEEAPQTSKVTTDIDDPEFDVHGDDMSIVSNSTSDVIKLDELEDDLGQATGQLHQPNDSRIVELFASALTKLDPMYERKDMSKELTLCVQDIYKRSCSKEGGCSAKENGRKISEALGGGYSGELRNAKEIVLTGRTSKRSQSQLRAGRQQGAVEIVCLDLLHDGNKLGNNVQVYPRFLLEIGEDRRKPHECLAFMEVIKAVHFSDCKEVEVWTKSTLRVALFSKDFRYFVVSLLT